jgi:spore coat protein A
LLEGTTWAAALAIGPSWCDRGGDPASTSPVEAGPPPGAPSAGCVGSAVPLPPRVPLHPDGLARFVDALPIPPVLAPEGKDTGTDAGVVRYRVAMREAEMRIHRDVPPTRVWSYGGVVPGPTIEVRSGEPVAIEWSNELPAKHFLPVDHSLHGAHAEQPEVRTIVHVHGAKVPPESDGYPEDAYVQGRSLTAHYPNRQDAALLWYHDHAMGIERLNQYAGLFGLYVIRDPAEEALKLPSGPYEIPLVLFDRILNADGSLHYPTSGLPDQPWVSEVYGDALLVNGKLYPFLEVEPRAYRFRVVNASNARTYDLLLSNGGAFQQIGSDQGLLAAPVTVTTVTVAPAERVDLVIDFSALAGQTVVLGNRAFELLQFRVAPTASSAAAPLPAKLRTIPRLAAASAVKTRTLTLNEYKDPNTQQMMMLLNATYWRQPVTEDPELDSVEIWGLMNLTEDTHPIHLHLVRFQLLDRLPFDPDEYLASGKMKSMGPPVPPTPGESGWKDTIRAEPGFVTRIIARFEGFPGRYVWHCHVLEHAANEMMRPFEVRPKRG